MRRRIIAGLVLAAAWISPAAAKVERIEILSRQPFAAGSEFGPVGAYEKLRGRATFALDPNAAANAAIADLKLAPRNNRGLVMFSTDFLVLRPVDPARGNGTLLYEVNNRGNIAMLGQLNEAPFSRNDPTTSVDAGNGFLFRQGFTRRETDDKFRRGVATGALAGCFAVLVHSFFDFTLHTTANALLFLILAALATQDSRVDQGSNYRGRRRYHSRSRAPELEAPASQPPALEPPEPA